MKTHTKRMLNASLLTLIAATTIAAQQQGSVTIRSNVPVEVRIFGAGPDIVFTAGPPLSVQTRKLPSGDYTIGFTLPDGSKHGRVLTIRKNCTTDLAVTYKPPTCPSCVPMTLTAPTITEQPKPEAPFEFKPEPVPTKFDDCCGCSRDDLKARLDLFAIQLHQNPTVRGRIVAANDVAILYLVNQRGVDRARLELQTVATNCVEFWILP